MTRDQGTHNMALVVIAGFRNLPNEKELSPSMGNGVPLSRDDSSSAMASRVLVCVEVKLQQTNCQ